MTEAWIPRGLRLEQAATYVGLSATTFLAQVAPDVPPVRLTVKRKVWLRDDLDRWLDARAGRAPSAGASRSQDEYEKMMGGYGAR
ncbi:helix-turn-helix transcriptional regulator [Komagataeibacter melomenusus]